MSAYFVGYLLGTYINPRIIHRVGHVRAFAIFAACASTTAILHALFVSPLFWAMLRVITGACMVGLYTVVESWLNTRAAPEQRSRVFASRSEEHTSELQSLMRITYAVFCLK